MEEREGAASWWGWLQDAREKVVAQSSEVYEFVKKDIDEFTKVVSSEASSVVSNTASSLKEKLQLDNEDSTATHMKQSVSGFLNHVAEVFTPPPEDDDQEAMRICNQQPVLITRLEASLYAISKDPGLFLPYSDDEEKKYNDWATSFDLPPEIQIMEILEENNTLKHLFEQMVPSKVSHLEFWDRYFYQVDLAKKAEKKREELKKRAQVVETDEKLEWDDDDEFGDEEDPIPEEKQQQLLEDYEKEKKSQGETGDEQKSDVDDSEEKEAKSPKKGDTAVKDVKPKPGTVKEADKGVKSKVNKDSKAKVQPAAKTNTSPSKASVSKASPSKTSPSKSSPSKNAVNRLSPEKELPVSPSRVSNDSSESNEDEWEKVDAVNTSPEQTAKEKGADWEQWK